MRGQGAAALVAVRMSAASTSTALLMDFVLTILSLHLSLQMATAVKPAAGKPGVEGEAPVVHRIRITLTSKVSSERS